MSIFKTCLCTDHLPGSPSHLAASSRLTPVRPTSAAPTARSSALTRGSGSHCTGLSRISSERRPTLLGPFQVPSGAIWRLSKTSATTPEQAGSRLQRTFPWRFCSRPHRDSLVTVEAVCLCYQYTHSLESHSSYSGIRVSVRGRSRNRQHPQHGRQGQSSQPSRKKALPPPLSRPAPPYSERFHPAFISSLNIRDAHCVPWNDKGGDREV